MQPSGLHPHPAAKSFTPAADVLISLAERANQVDRLVSQAASDLLFLTVPTDLALVAVGGYGRRQLFPFSDVDLLLLVQTDDLPRAHKPEISAFLQRLWDSGLRVSQSVRTPEECLTVHDQNTELNISLLDQRFLAGDRPLYANLSKKFPRFVQSNRDALMRNLVRLTRERHAKYADTFYHLEPNVKETPGGLRDLQFVRWMEQLHDADANRVTTPEAPDDLRQAFHFLAGLRFALHTQAGRDQSQLTFDAQDALADNGEGKDVAAWMRAYYRHARTVSRAATRSLEQWDAQSSALFAQFVGWRSRLSNSEFSVHRERVHFRLPQQLESGPEVVLRLFEFVARHGLRLSTEAVNQLEPRLTRLREYFDEPRSIWPALNQILSQAHAPLAVRAMHETGVLFALFPGLEQIECLVVRDFFHRYTVDEHTLVAMQNAWSAPAAYGELLQELPQKGVLAFALLFHDAGKFASGAESGYTGHVEASLAAADAAMRRIRMPAAEREAVTFLIRNHMQLSSAMRSRDLADPKAVHDVAQIVGTQDRLKALTLLTYADISAVNPNVMTPWRSLQLWQLYLALYRELTRELAAERIAESPIGAGSELLAGLPVRYLRTHSEEEIAAHVALAAKSEKHGAAVDVRALDSAWQLTAITGDRPGLFARMAGTLAGFGMNILRAEAFSNHRGQILDTFVFADPTRTLELNPSEVDRLRTTAERVILGKVEVRELLRNRPKPKPPSRKVRVPTAVRFDNEASASATLIEITAEDRPGLLYDLASAISSCGGNIEVVLIDTQANRAIDVFYVTVGGGKLTEEAQAAMGEELRKACGAGL
jgi:[protein-PII] uridylyltransferase